MTIEEAIKLFLAYRAGLITPISEAEFDKLDTARLLLQQAAIDILNAE